MAKLKPAEIQPKVAKEIVLPTIPRPRLRRKPWRKTGPRLYRLAKDPEHLGGPGEPPTEFLSAQTTKTEWYVYWALSKLYDDPEDPRVGQWIAARAAEVGDEPTPDHP